MTLAEQIAAAAIDTHGAIQRHEELRELLEWLDDELPDEAGILEVGSDHGGTLYAWRNLRPHGRVVAVSLTDGPYATHRPVIHHGAIVFDVDSHDAESVRVVSLLEPAGFDLLFIDGDHTYDGCLADVNDYGPLLRPGGILALHDISNGDDVPDLGCPQVWADIQHDPAWTDPRTFVAPNPSWGGIGTLRRV